MVPRMPRGAIPSKRSELAAAEPYRPEGQPELFVPSGGFPTPDHELAAARPYRPDGASPDHFLAWPGRLDLGGDLRANHSTWAEEAFAQSCADPAVVLSPDMVLSAARACGSSNFAAFMQTRGFQQNGVTYQTGPFRSVDWTDVAILNAAIAETGPVKIGIAAVNLAASAHGSVTPKTSGWAIHGVSVAQPQDHCASLCGYGALSRLVGLFDQRGVAVDVPAGMPTDLGYAMFLWGSIGIIDHGSLMNITGEAWVRTPTSIVRFGDGTPVSRSRHRPPP